MTLFCLYYSLDMNSNQILLALIVPITWGFGYALAKIGMDQFTPLLLMSLRFGVFVIVGEPRLNDSLDSVTLVVIGTVFWAIPTMTFDSVRKRTRKPFHHLPLCRTLNGT